MAGEARNTAMIAAAAVVITGYAVLFLWVDSELWSGVLLVVGAALGLLGKYAGLGALPRTAMSERVTNIGAVAGVLVLVLVFAEDHFTILMIATALIYVAACVGFNIQFGMTGLLNFAGAAFFGVGCYTAAVLGAEGTVPPLTILLLGGVFAAAIGSLLIWPVLRTRGHYAALVTIAFGILFKTFLEVNDSLGGPQGLPVAPMSVLGWDFNQPIVLPGGSELSFMANYLLAALVLLVLAMSLFRRLERSWVGLNMDAVRLDETAAGCFGIDVARWKITAFTIGNFVAGVAGALYATLIGYIAPTNFTFADSLIFVSIVLLGGLGSMWGTALAAAIVVVLPEKLQLIQEYRFLLFAALVIVILLFRPDGLVPRRARLYFAKRARAP